MLRMSRWLSVLLLLQGCGAPTLLSQVDGARAQALGSEPSVQNFKKVHDGLYRGGLPDDEDLAALDALGIKTDVDLMGAFPTELAQVKHEREAAAKLGIDFVSIPLPTKEVPAAMVDQFLAIVRDPARQPVYVHCLHGRDRTGTMISTYRIAVDGLTGEEALAEMRTFGFEPKKYPVFAAFVLAYPGLN